ncbi:glutathione S-transferase [Mycena filopes]|nr:glutathione S-transferase [Mycena filopes]
MAILKLYGASYATTAHRVAIVLHELKIPFELVEVDIMKGEQRKPEHLARQPFGHVPYIDDDGFILYESRAICRSLAAKHESALLPTELEARAVVEQAASVELAEYDPYAAPAGLAFFKRTRFGIPLDQAHTLTLVDFFHLPSAPLVASGGSDIMTRRPNVAR